MHIIIRIQNILHFGVNKVRVIFSLLETGKMDKEDTCLTPAIPSFWVCIQRWRCPGKRAFMGFST